MKKKIVTYRIGEQWNLLDTMLSGMYEEIDKLCKKKPDMLLSDMKTKKINKLITLIKELIEGENPFIADIEELDQDDPCELSDVISVLNELKEGLRIFKQYHLYRGHEGHGWYEERKSSDV